MDNLACRRICITIPPEMLRELDKLCDHYFTNRSSLIRRALAKLMDEPTNKAIINPENQVTALKYEIIKGEHPYLDPNDGAMIKMLYDLKSAEQNK